MANLKNAHTHRLPLIKALVIVLMVPHGFNLPLSSAPTPDSSRSKALIGRDPVEAFPSIDNLPNDQPSLALSTETQSNKFPSQLDSEAIICGRAAFDSGEKDSIKGGNLPKGPIPKCTINPIGSPRPRSLRKPDGPEPVRKARPKERDKWIDAIRNHWLEYFKKISRKLLSTITTNTAAGNKWKIVNVDPIVNLTSMEIPKQLSSPQNMFQSIMNRPEDGEGDITGLLDQVVSLTPIGPLVHRTEVDLNFDLEQVAQLFFVSPRRSTTQLSSAGRDDIPHVTASQSRTGQPITTDMGATDPLKAFLLDRPPQKGKSYIREGLKEHNLVFQPLHSPKLFKDAFIFWLATALRQTHPFENQSWLSLCPFKFGGESLSSLTPCVVTFTNSKKDHIQSIITYDLPFR